MGGLAYFLLSLGVFAATAAIFHCDARRTGIVYLQQTRAARLIFSALSWLFLGATFILTGVVAGWELAVPVWLCLLCTMGVTSLFIAALSRRWHMVCGACAGIISLAVASAAGIFGWLA